MANICNIQCGPGYVYDQRKDQCVPVDKSCPNGYVWSNLLQRCLPIPGGQRNRQCPTGYTYDYSSRKCIPDTGPPALCPPGHIRVNGECVLDPQDPDYEEYDVWVWCPLGYSFDKRTGLCIKDDPSDPDKPIPDPEDVIKPVPPDGDTTYPILCPDGYLFHPSGYCYIPIDVEPYEPDDEDKDPPCKDGLKYNPKTDLCEPECPDGTYWNPTAGKCEPLCPDENFYYDPINEICVECIPPDTWDPRLFRCVKCGCKEVYLDGVCVSFDYITNLTGYPTTANVPNYNSTSPTPYTVRQLARFVYVPPGGIPPIGSCTSLGMSDFNYIDQWGNPTTEIYQDINNYDANDCFSYPVSYYDFVLEAVVELTGIYYEPIYRVPFKPVHPCYSCVGNFDPYGSNVDVPWQTTPVQLPPHWQMPKYWDDCLGCTEDLYSLDCPPNYFDEFSGTYIALKQMVWYQYRAGLVQSAQVNCIPPSDPDDYYRFFGTLDAIQCGWIPQVIPTPPTSTIKVPVPPCTPTGNDDFGLWSFYITYEWTNFKPVEITYPTDVISIEFTVTPEPNSGDLNISFTGNRTDGWTILREKIPRGSLWQTIKQVFLDTFVTGHPSIKYRFFLLKSNGDKLQLDIPEYVEFASIQTINFEPIPECP